MTQNCLPIVQWLKSWFTPKDEEYKYTIQIRNPNDSSYRYRPLIDETVRVGVTVTDGNGNTVPNHSFNLLWSEEQNGSYFTTLTTNSSGFAYYDYTCSVWGVVNFRVGTENAQILIRGWKKVETLADSRIKVYQNDKIVHVTVYGTWNLTSATTNVLATISSNYRPLNANASIGINTSNANRVYIWTNGNVTLYSLASQTGNTQIQCSFTYGIL